MSYLSISTGLSPPEREPLMIPAPANDAEREALQFVIEAAEEHGAELADASDDGSELAVALSDLGHYLEGLSRGTSADLARARQVVSDQLFVLEQQIVEGARPENLKALYEKALRGEDYDAEALRIAREAFHGGAELLEKALNMADRLLAAERGETS